MRKIKFKTPWLSKLNKNDSHWGEDVMTICVDGLKDYFTIPRGAKKIRLIASSSRLRESHLVRLSKSARYGWWWYTEREDGALTCSVRNFLTEKLGKHGCKLYIQVEYR